MRVLQTELDGVVVIEPKVYGDSRGYFLETWNQVRYVDAGLPAVFLQDNLSYSRRGVLRGLHFQNPNAQGKLVYVLKGEVYDVAVDIRVGSPTYGRWTGQTLSEDNKRQLYIPAGFAHGFCVTSEDALFVYKCTTTYDAAAEGAVRWNDSEIGINWPQMTFELSDKDRGAPLLSEIERIRLPAYQQVV